MKPTLLQFAKNTDGDVLELPLSMLMQTIFLGGNKGAGKTSAMKRLFEAAHGAGAQCGVIAPLGRWWSLRISANGRGRGLRDVFVFGGKHGDVGISAGSGPAVARTVVQKRIHFVLDVELMRKEDRAQFVGDFLEELWQLTKERDVSHPMVLFIDEAQVVAPQKSTSKLVERMREFAADLCREGRNHGIGMVLGAQRSANVDKDLLALVEMLIVMRTIHHLDRKVYAAWVDEKGETDDDEGAWLKRLRRLEKGQAYIYAPELNVFERVNVLLPDTYDATKTATLGAKVARIGSLSKLDVRKLGEELTAVVAETEANDPGKLKARVTELERALAKSMTNRIVEKAARPQKPDLRSEKRLAKQARVGGVLATKLERLVEKLAEAGSVYMAAAEKLRPGTVIQPGYSIGVSKESAGPVRVIPSMPVPKTVHSLAARGAARFEKFKRFGERYNANPTAVYEQAKRNGANGHNEVPVDIEPGPTSGIAIVGKMQTMLDVLANGPLERAEMHGAVGMSAGSSFRAYVGRLKAGGFVDEANGTLSSTSRGAGYVEDPASMTTDSVLERNRGFIIGKMTDMMRVVRQHTVVNRRELPELVGMSEGSSFRAYVGRLKSRGLLVENAGQLSLSPLLRRGGG